MKKIIILIITVFLVSFTRVEAASVNINASKTSATVGESVTITVTSYAGAWNLHVSGAVSGSIVGYDEDSNVTKTQTYTLKPTSAGTYTVTLTGDVTDYDTEERIADINKSVTITFSNPAPKPDPEPEPEKPTQTNTNANTNTNTNNTSNSTSKTTNKQTETKQEEPKQEEKKEEVKEQVIDEKKLKINKFYVVGYDIDFREDKLDYTINIDKNLKAIYIVVEGEDLEVTGDKEIDITNKSTVVVRLKSGNKTEEYTIKLNKIDNTIKEKNNNINTDYILIGIGAVIFFLGAYIIIKKKRDKKHGLN